MENFLTEPDDQLFGTEETPSDSSTEKEPEQTEEQAPGQAEDAVEEVPNDLDDRPLHKDKRFKSVIEERNALRERNAQILEELAEARKPQPQVQTTTQGKPEWFKKVFGEDDDVWNGFQSMTAQAKEAAKQEALQEIEAKQSEAQETQKRANEWVEEQVSSLQETEGDFDRNALFKVMDKYRPTDEQGNLDFKAGLELLRLQNPPEKEKGQARRKLADKLNSSPGKTEPTAKAYVTSADLRRMGGWDSITE